jgi:hypothetical protein
MLEISGRRWRKGVGAISIPSGSFLKPVLLLVGIDRTPLCGPQLLLLAAARRRLHQRIDGSGA